MTDDEKALVLASMEAIEGDPTAAVYARLFATHPEMEALFVMDSAGAVRGHMLQEAFQSLLDLVGAGQYGVHMIQAELRTHDGIGVPPKVFATFYPIVRDTLRDKAGAAWTAQTDAAWEVLLGEIIARIEAVAVPA